MDSSAENQWSCRAALVSKNGQRCSFVHLCFFSYGASGMFEAEHLECFGSRAQELYARILNRCCELDIFRKKPIPASVYCTCDSSMPNPIRQSQSPDQRNGNPRHSTTKPPQPLNPTKCDFVNLSHNPPHTIQVLHVATTKVS
jgi:hypothetical protein